MDKNKELEELLNPEFVKQLAKAIMPSLIYDLLSSGKLDRDKLEDRNYIIGLVKSLMNDKEYVLPKVQITRYQDFKNSIESELLHDRIESAIILTGVCIEHLLNHFYQSTLSLKYDLSENDVLSAVSSLNIRDKTTWFFKIVSEHDMNSNILSNIMFINKLRNELVHYKADPRDLDDDTHGAHNRIKKYISTLNNDILLNTINELESFLKSIERNIDEDLELAHELTIRYFG